MFKRWFFFFTLLVLSFQNVKAMDPISLDNELGYYLKHGHTSPAFFDNVGATQIKQQADSDIEKNKQAAATHLRQLSRQNEWSDTSLLLRAKALELSWSSIDSATFGDMCHRLRHLKSDKKTRALLAYRGFESLRVFLREPKFNYHISHGLAPEVIFLLEDLRESVTGFRRVSDFLASPSRDILSPHCLPEAEVCFLLMIAHSAPILAGEEIPTNLDETRARYGHRALTLYQEGLQGSTTPEERDYFHTQILNLVSYFKRTLPIYAEQDSVQHASLARKSGAALARIYKDKLETVNSVGAKAFYAYKIACAYYLGGHTKKALKFIQYVLNSEYFKRDEQMVLLDSLKIKAGHLETRIKNPGNVLEYEMQFFDNFWPHT